jgi:hypothetical protein
MRRPQYVMFPEDEAGFGIDDQYYVGSSGLLVKPVTQKGVKEVSVYIAEDQARSFPLPLIHPDIYTQPPRSTTTTSPTMPIALKTDALPSPQTSTKSHSSSAEAPSSPPANAPAVLPH